MRFALDDDQQVIVSTIRRFVDAEIEAKAGDADREATAPAKLLATAGEVGFLLDAVPAEADGLLEDSSSPATPRAWCPGARKPSWVSARRRPRKCTSKTAASTATRCWAWTRTPPPDWATQRRCSTPRVRSSAPRPWASPARPSSTYSSGSRAASFVARRWRRTSTSRSNWPKWTWRSARRACWCTGPRGWQTTAWRTYAPPPRPKRTRRARPST